MPYHLPTMAQIPDTIRAQLETMWYRLQGIQSIYGHLAWTYEQVGATADLVYEIVGQQSWEAFYTREVRNMMEGDTVKNTDPIPLALRELVTTAVVRLAEISQSAGQNQALGQTSEADLLKQSQTFTPVKPSRAAVSSPYGA